MVHLFPAFWRTMRICFSQLTIRRIHFLLFVNYTQNHLELQTINHVFLFHFVLLRKFPSVSNRSLIIIECETKQLNAVAAAAAKKKQIQTGSRRMRVKRHLNEIGRPSFQQPKWCARIWREYSLCCLFCYVIRIYARYICYTYMSDTSAKIGTWKRRCEQKKQNSPFLSPQSAIVKGLRVLNYWMGLSRCGSVLTCSCVILFCSTLSSKISVICRQ